MKLYPQMELAAYAGGSLVLLSFVSLGGFFDLPLQDGASFQSPFVLQFELIFLGVASQEAFSHTPPPPWLWGNGKRVFTVSWSTV